MPFGSLQNAGVFRIVNDVDDGRKAGNGLFRYGTAVDIGKHADRRAVYQDIAPAGSFKGRVINRFDTDPFRKFIEFRLRVRVSGYDDDRFGLMVKEVLDDGPGPAAGAEDDAVLIFYRMPA